MEKKLLILKNKYQTLDVHQKRQKNYTNSFRFIDELNKIKQKRFDCYRYGYQLYLHDANFSSKR